MKLITLNEMRDKYDFSEGTLRRYATSKEWLDNKVSMKINGKWFFDEDKVNNPENLFIKRNN